MEAVVSEALKMPDLQLKVAQEGKELVAWFKVA
jgi:hypothetical protein